VDYTPGVQLQARPLEADVLLPEREFYWAVIEGGSTGDPNAPAARMALDEAFERDLPEPFDGLVVRYAPIPTAVVGCAIRADRARAALDAGAVVLRPRELPAAIRERAGDRASSVLGELNILVGEFEPAVIAGLRVARRRILLAGAAASLLLVAGGLWLRSEGLERHSERALARASTTLLDALPTRAGGLSGEAAALRLQRELEHLKRARGAEAEKARLRDAADGLAALLAAWPNDVETRVASVQVAATQITLTVDVPDAGSAETLSKALQGVVGWSLQPPRTEINGGQARVTAILRPQQKSETGPAAKSPGKEGRS
jgi:hypothetical protein